MIQFLKNILTNLTAFLREEKAYAFLLLINLGFYLISALSNAEPPAATLESPALQQFKQVESSYENLSAQQIFNILEKNPTLAKFAMAFNFLFLFFLITGLGVGLWVLVRYFLCKPILSRGYEPEIFWELRDLARFMILAFSFLIISSCWFDLASFAFGISPEANWLVLLSATSLDLFSLFVILHFAGWKYGRSLESLGLTLRSFFKEVGIGLLAYAWVVPVFLLMVLALGYVIKHFHMEPAPHELIDILVEEDKRDTWLVIYSLGLACLVGPFIEEVFFRGFLYGVLKKFGGVGFGILVSSAAFAMVHNSWFAFLPIFFLGAVLAWLREQRGSLTASIVMHMTHNTFLMGYFFILKRGILDQL